jgi:hypothetical protein
LVWFGEIERKLAKLSMTTITIGRRLRKVMNMASVLNYCLFHLVLLSLEGLTEMDSTVA